MTENNVPKHRQNYGLVAVKCQACSHCGFYSCDDIIILFGNRHEQVCGYGSSRATLRVVFSAEALQQFESLRLPLAETTKYVAQWALLCGRMEGTVDLMQDTVTLSQCYDYIRRYMVGELSPAA
jgi:hypothetical protein